MATTRIIEAIEWAYGIGIPSSGPEAATQTFLKGDLVTYSSGYLQECGADPSLIAGVALDAGGNTTSAGDQQCSYMPLAGNVFKATLAQAAANTTSAATDIGKKYGVIVRTAAPLVWVVDSSETSSTRCVILNWVTPTISLDINARVYISFFNANDQLTA